MKNKLLNKILHKSNKTTSDKNNFDYIKSENKKLKKDNNDYKENEIKLNKQNKQFSDQIIQLKKENDNLKKLNSFNNFQEFLANSYVSPFVNAPFNAQDKRVFAFMDYLSKYLIQNTMQLKDKPLVSIIMPTHNQENIIQKAIDSVLKQTYENWELLIIDYGCAGNTLNFFNKIDNPKIKILSYDKNKRLASARNTGLNNAEGEYIMYLDSDNEWDPKYIETMIGAFLELPDAHALYSGQLLYKDYNSKPYAVRFGAYNKELLHNRNYIDINCFCHKKLVYKEIGGFTEDLIKLIDWDYILRISNKFKIYSVPVLLSKDYESISSDMDTELPFDYLDESSKIIKDNTNYSERYDALKHKVSIIIPSFEAFDELKECIETILSFKLDEMLDIIVVDNNSSVNVKKYLKKLESNKKIKLILNDINYGFSYAVNQGIELSDSNSDILILNNDAVLTEGTIEHLQNGAYSYNDCGIIVPHELVSEKSPHMNLHVPYADSEFKCDITPSKEHHNIINMQLFHDGGLLELDFAPFFCTYIKREVYSKTLGLDPELGRHYRSDRIFSDFVRHILKLKIYQEPYAHVYHKHQTATKILKKNKKEYELMFSKNQWPPELAKKLGYKKALWD